MLILKTESTCLHHKRFFFPDEPFLKPNLDTKTNIMYSKCAWMSSGEVPAVNIELCVCVFRARSMTEQQEQSEETGLLSTQDLEPVKDDNTHGHFRQISHQHTHCSATLAVFLCSFFSPTHHLHPVHGHGLQPLEIYFHSTYFALLFQLCLISNNSQTRMHAWKQREHKQRFTKDVSFPLKTWRKDMGLENLNCCSYTAH